MFGLSAHCNLHIPRTTVKRHLPTRQNWVAAAIRYIYKSSCSAHRNLNLTGIKWLARRANVFFARSKSSASGARQFVAWPVATVSDECLIQCLNIKLVRKPLPPWRECTYRSTLRRPEKQHYRGLSVSNYYRPLEARAGQTNRRRRATPARQWCCLRTRSDASLSETGGRGALPLWILKFFLLPLTF